jgi:bla regulator protein BlaR1
VSAACHLHTINELKGRLRMLSKDRVSKARLTSGVAAVAAVALVSLGLTASGTQAAERLRSGMKDSIGVDLARLDAPKAPVGPVGAVAPVGPAAPVAPQAADLPPPPKLAEAPPAPPAAKSSTHRHTKIIIRSKDGKIQTIDSSGDDIEAEIARVLPESKIKIMTPEVIERNCANVDGKPVVKQEDRDGKHIMIVCRNRIERMANDAKRHAERAEIVMLRSGDIERDARRSALDGVRAARDSILANRDMSDASRAAALKGIDQAIAELEANATKAK